MKPRIERVTIESINDKGYGVGLTDDGQKVHCLNALPGEVVEARLFKRKSGVYQAETVSVITPSSNRVEPKDEAFTSTSPLQIMKYEAELAYKAKFIKDLYSKIEHIEFQELFSIEDNQWNYRNKVEFSFYADDDDSIRLAFHKRGSSKGKIPVSGTSIANTGINQAALQITDLLNQRGFSARSFKSLIVRSSDYTKSVSSALYCKESPESEVYKEVKNAIKESFSGNIQLIYSNPLSPASITTQNIFSQGESVLVEQIHGKLFSYPIDSFFQVNIPVFEQIIYDIRHCVVTTAPHSKAMRALDLYAGVGTIGISVSDLFGTVDGVELFDLSHEFATANANTNHVYNYNHTIASSGEVVGMFSEKECIIVDPPRTGLEPKVIAGILQYLPEYVIYLSCNPITQVRDYELLIQKYQPVFARAYNMYPKTPHLESLIILKKHY